MHQPFRQDRTHATPDLPKAVPLGRRKHEPIRESLEPSRFARRYDPGLSRMDWSNGLVATEVRTSPSSKGGAKTIEVQPLRF